MAAEKEIRPTIQIGYRVGKLTVIQPTDRRKSGYTVWLCRCGCGCLQRKQIVDNLRLVDGTSVTLLETAKNI